MQLSEVQFQGAVPFSGYGPGFFRIGEQVIEGAAFVRPGHAQGWDGLSETQSLIAAAAEIDVLLLGMGADIAHPPASFVSALEAAGIGVEIMSSPAACRTYNVLLGEGRRVAAAVLAVL